MWGQVAARGAALKAVLVILMVVLQGQAAAWMEAMAVVTAVVEMAPRPQ